MKERIQYIDAVKGFAIFLMVFAHSIGWNMSDWQNICRDSNSLDGFLWQLIYSFHMPLFFMVSGYFQPLHTDSYLRIIKKKSLRLLLPYVTTGFLMLLIRGYYGYWFLFSLWEMAIVYVLYLFISQKVNTQRKPWVDIVLIFSGYVILKYALNTANLSNPYCEPAKFLGYYFPFFLGVIIKKYDVVRNLLVQDKMLTYYFILFVVVFSLRYWVNTEGILGATADKARRILPYLGSLTTILIFKCHAVKTAEKLFAYLGKKTMQIYVFHILFMIQLPVVGDWLITNLGGG